MDDLEVEGLIRGARPVPPTRDPATLASLDQMTAAVARKSGYRVRDSVRRGSREAVIAVALVGVLGATTAAAAVVVARTGWFTAVTSEQDGTEWLDTGGTDYSSVVADLAPDYLAYPAGLTASDAASWVVGATKITGGLVQETGVVRSYETYALCTWTETWLAAAPGSATRESAADHLTDAADWPALTVTDGGGVLDAVRALGRAARDGDAAGVEAQSAVVCPSGLLGDR
ncbi:MAG: hypothetical protein QM675_11825 [Protaetiibacter sp.]